MKTTITLEQAIAKASPLPWRAEILNSETHRVLPVEGFVICDDETYYPAATKPEDQVMIAHAVTVLPALVTEMERTIWKLQDTLDATRSFLDPKSVRSIEVHIEDAKAALAAAQTVQVP